MLREKKTGKVRRITLNRSVQEAIKNLLVSMSAPDDEDYLFLGLRGNPLTVPTTLSRMVKA